MKHSNDVGEFLFLTLGVLLAGMGIEGFLVPAGFIDGGITGTSMLLARLTEFSLPFFLTLINLPFLLLGYFQVGRRFALRSTIGVFALACALVVLPFPHLTSDRVLAAVFGGMFLGAGIGLSIRGGGVLDGTEILALLISRKIGSTVGDIVLVFNVLIFSCAAYSIGFEPALYSVLTYASAAKAMDYILHGVEEYYSLLIVSDNSDKLRDAIISELGRSITRLSGKFGRSEEPREILLSILTRLEIAAVRSLVLSIDPRAFIVIQPVRDVTGGVVKARPVERLVGSEIP